jgi:RNA polymerase sigma-70 factor (ECF subfamily)
MSALASMTAPSDEELAERIVLREESEHALRRAQEACRDLYQRYSRPLLTFLSARIRRDELEDVHQAVWERVWRRLPGGFHGGNFRAWLYQVARNYVIDESRKAGSPGDALPSDSNLPDHRPGGPDEFLVERERMLALQRCLEQLPPATRQLVAARLGGEDYQAVCQQLGLSADRAYKLFHNAKNLLQTCIERALT